MSVDNCGFGREPDGFCMDETSLDVRKIQLEIRERAKERTRIRLAENAIKVSRQSVDIKGER